MATEKSSDSRARAWAAVLYPSLLRTIGVRSSTLTILSGLKALSMNLTSTIQLASLKSLTGISSSLLRAKEL